MLGGERVSELPLISVIVPVYNVEKYISRCVDSLLGQTYKNIEIILVDDGSSDDSSLLCDHYASENKNVIVIHKKNGGQSSARNEGLRLARGQYIGFVDSDDWISNDMYEYLYNLIIGYDADASSIWFVTCKTEDDVATVNQENINVLHGDEILEFHLKEALCSGTHSMCRCLFKASIIRGMRYPEGYVNEDIPFKFEALSKTGTFVSSNLVKYFYYQDSESTTRGGFKPKDLSLFPMTEKLYEMAYPYGGNIRRLAEIKKIRSDFSILSRIAYYGSECDNEYTDKVITKCTKKLRSNYFKLLKAPIPVSRKVIMSMFVIDYRIAKMFISIAKKIYDYNG